MTVAAQPLSVELAVNTAWVLVAGLLVMFMQAGFMFMEAGLSRMKNAGAACAKVLLNFSIAGVVYWAVGFAVAFGGAGAIMGDTGFFFHGQGDLPQLEGKELNSYAFFFFQFVFCAVSLAIVWGATLERISLIAYVIYATVFAAFLYPLVSHWIFGSGWLQETLGMQDYAGSTVVHLTGAVAGFAALLLLGPRIGRFDEKGTPRRIQGHSMPMVAIAVVILWFGWFGFNAGSGLTATHGRIADVVIVTNLAAAAAGISASGASIWLTGKAELLAIATGIVGGLVAITAPSGYVDPWAAVVIGAIAGVVVVISMRLLDRYLDDAVGMLSSHGVAGIWGTVACGLFTAPDLAKHNGVGRGGLFYTGEFQQLGVQVLGVAVVAAFVFCVSYLVFWLMRKTVGLRVAPEIEERGLDIAEHGAPAYPEQLGDVQIPRKQRGPSHQ